MLNENLEFKTCENSAILLGVPKVGYGVYGCTPFPICLKACASYLGKEFDYSYVMVASGAAFRLTWDTTSWNGGNVDVIFTYDNPEEIYKNGLGAIGCEYQVLGRSNTTKKDEFKAFITKQIDRGYPCIALGIIGPPEACIITGYRDGGNTLLGWNFFQDSPEFGSEVSIDESGYFVTSSWWENADTLAVMRLDKNSSHSVTLKEIIEGAIKALSGRICGKYAKGIAAYDAWEKAILTESDFEENSILPILAEHLMCQGDAMDCLSDGRHNASLYLKKIADEYPTHAGLLKDIERTFGEVANLSCKMTDTLGGWQRGEMQMRNLAKASVRNKIASLIGEAKKRDEMGLILLEKLYDSL